VTQPLFDLKMPDNLSSLPKDYSGPVFISDIDKTYLATQIDTVSGLIRAALETAERKANVPGFSIILRALRRGAGVDPTVNPLVFLSASPPQLEKKLISKMSLDGIEFDGIIFKNQLAHVRKAELRKLKEHVAYKLYALLRLREFLPANSDWYLFGDDSETDAFVFSLFSDILVGSVHGKDLIELLRFLGVHRTEAISLGWMCRTFRVPSKPVKGIFINLETGSQPSYYRNLNPLIFPTENSLQLAFALFEKKLIREQAVVSVAKEMVVRYDYDLKELEKSLNSALESGLYSAAVVNYLSKILYEKSLLLNAFHALEKPLISLENEVLTKKIAPNLSALKRKYSGEGRY
jgi:hypothetical protein